MTTTAKGARTEVNGKTSSGRCSHFTIGKKRQNEDDDANEKGNSVGNEERGIRTTMKTYRYVQGKKVSFFTPA